MKSHLVEMLNKAIIIVIIIIVIDIINNIITIKSQLKRRRLTIRKTSCFMIFLFFCFTSFVSGTRS